MASKLLVILLLVISPIWPLGQNPLVGDPYLIVNKRTNEMAYIVGGEVEKVYQVSTGKTDELTPEGEFSVVVKAVNPYYRRKNIEGGTKENPLGTRWIGFNAEETDGRIYGIHGNNDPNSIGHYITGGCVRMFNEEIEELFQKIPYGTKIFITSSEKDFVSLGQEQGAIE
ncbi:L,D-transpeptidase [Anaerobacillus sp. CMMVII]|uniref:L,D-transpeptidase n=1 Tax=Anaerobacillus sp. CMMVII TaxID=2755588 RepID=UPI0021B72BEB|nr:L,D-transpeptidase [Anaerobacillus sp. CMMVII]MCT8138735.1 L,D-transpeptidase [Anaerobacillus sp. CMMVII]